MWGGGPYGFRTLGKYGKLTAFVQVQPGDSRLVPEPVPDPSPPGLRQGGQDPACRHLPFSRWGLVYTTVFRTDTPPPPPIPGYWSRVIFSCILPGPVPRHDWTGLECYVPPGKCGKSKILAFLFFFFFFFFILPVPGGQQCYFKM
jgi:hypothetical protein